MSRRRDDNMLPIEVSFDEPADVSATSAMHGATSNDSREHSGDTEDHPNRRRSVQLALTVGGLLVAIAMLALWSPWTEQDDNRSLRPLLPASDGVAISVSPPLGDPVLDDSLELRMLLATDGADARGGEWVSVSTMRMSRTDIGDLDTYLDDRTGATLNPVRIGDVDGIIRTAQLRFAKGNELVFAPVQRRAWVVSSSMELTDDELIALGEAIRIDDDSVSMDPTSTTDSMRVLWDGSGYAPVGTYSLLGETDGATRLMYTVDDVPVTLTYALADGATFERRAAFVDAAATPITIDGADEAFTVDLPNLANTVLQRRGGLEIALSGRLGASRLQELAAQIDLVSAQRWHAERTGNVESRRLDRADAGDSALDFVGLGQFEDGTIWVAHVVPSRGRSAARVTFDFGEPRMADVDLDEPDIVVLRDGDRRVIVAVAPADRDELRLVVTTSTGIERSAPLEILPDSEERAETQAAFGEIDNETTDTTDTTDTTAAEDRPVGELHASAVTLILDPSTSESALAKIVDEDGTVIADISVD